MLSLGLNDDWHTSSSIGLRPQHFKDILSYDTSWHVFLPKLAAFVQLVLEGRTPSIVYFALLLCCQFDCPMKNGGNYSFAGGCTLVPCGKIAAGSLASASRRCRNSSPCSQDVRWQAQRSPLDYQAGFQQHY